MSNIPPIKNPYAAPVSSLGGVAANSAEVTRNQYLSHEASVKSIGLLYMLGGLLGLLLGLGYIVGGIVMMTNPNVEFPFVFLIILGFVCLCMSAVQLYGAISIRKLGDTGRIIVTIFSCVGLLGIPIGTLISGYFLYLLWSEKGKFIFTPHYREIMEATPHIKYKTSVVVWIFLGLLLLLVAAGIIGAVVGG